MSDTRDWQRYAKELERASDNLIAELRAEIATLTERVKAAERELEGYKSREKVMLREIEGYPEL